MAEQYLKKIIAKSPDDLQFISACCQKAKVKVSDIKYLSKSKIFVILLERYNRETVEIKYNNKSISDILDMTVEEGYIFFNKI